MYIPQSPKINYKQKFKKQTKEMTGLEDEKDRDTVKNGDIMI